MSRSLLTALPRSFVLVLFSATGLALAGCDHPTSPSSGSPGESDLTASADAQSSAAEVARMKAHFENLYDASHVRHSFSLPSGDAVDCVDVDKQPATRHPAMSGHSIATPPPAIDPKGPAEAPKGAGEVEAFLKPGTLNAQGVEMACPKGTVPIRRVGAEELTRFRTLEDRFRKHPGDQPRTGDMGHPFSTEQESGEPLQAPTYGPSTLHQHSMGYQYVANTGASFTNDVWEPFVETGSEFSLGQVWVVGGSGNNLQTLEAGSQTFYNLYGNWAPHLFIYSTSNNYISQGCYNLDCGRFVQVNSSIVIGGNLSTSAWGGAQVELGITYLLYNGNWWLQVNGVWAGYYPGYLYNAAGVANGATIVEFGGEIIDDRSAHPSRHTETGMGSGAFPASGYDYAAYMRNMYYYATDGATTYWTALTPYTDDASCYDVMVYSGDPSWGTYLYYGGQGYNYYTCQ
jgi:hypothetical protein